MKTSRRDFLSMCAAAGAGLAGGLLLDGDCASWWCLGAPGALPRALAASVRAEMKSRSRHKAACPGCPANGK